jgi:uncharacterized damage-inducible protein DinB
MTADELTVSLGREAGQELASALNRIKHCLNQLSDEQVWWRSQPSMNSIGNLLLHLGGNVRQWLISGLGGVPDTRNRPAEFSERGPIPKDELLRRLETVVDEARAVLARQTAEQVMQVRRIQKNEVSGLAALFHSVAHFRGHTQEIVHMTRLLLGDVYHFQDGR